MEAFIQNLRSGLRLAFGQKVSLGDFVINLVQVAIFFGLTVLFGNADVVFSEDFDAGSEFLLAAVVWLIWIICLLLIILLLGKSKWKEFILVLSSASLVVYIFTLLAFLLPGMEDDSELKWTILAVVAYVVVLLFSFYVLYRSLRLVYQSSRTRAIVISVVTYLLLIGGAMAAFYFVYFDDQDYQTDLEEEYETISVENTYYRQKELVEKQLAALSGNQPGKMDMFMVGFAPYSYQDVFIKEMRYAIATIQERFKDRAQSIELVNHEDTVEELPLANKPNLEAVLKRVNSMMDQNEDVLMLFLSSHGSEEGELSAYYWPLEPEPMSAQELSGILDRSKVKWRIIVVSACYSGLFIDPLKNEYSLIITASAGDKKSFGCDNDRELTYFGEAFFKYGLPQANSFQEAFQVAKKWVTEKEIKEELEPSEPQIYVGEAMEAYLERFEK